MKSSYYWFLLLLSISLGWFWANNLRQSRVEAVGGLVFFYHDAPIDQPLFALSPINPGQCLMRQITIKNQGLDSEMVAFRGQGESRNPDLEANLVLTAKMGQTTLNETLLEFLNKDQETQLEIVQPEGTGQIDLSLCLPHTADNQLQDQMTSFDLEFGKLALATELPAECQDFTMFLSKSNYQNKPMLQRNAKGRLKDCLDKLE
jgi:hypothetical protein